VKELFPLALLKIRACVITEENYEGTRNCFRNQRPVDDPKLCV